METLEWTYDKENNLILLQDKIKLYCGEEAPNLSIVENTDLNNFSKFWIFEWTEYRVRFIDTEGKVKIKSLPVDKDKDGYFKFCYQNYIGKSKIEFEIPGQSIPPLEIEIISKKLSEKDSDLYYPKFYSKLVNEITNKIYSLPFQIITPTHFLMK